jgi:hypothetical protein
MIPRTTTKRDFLRRATIMPRGSAPRSVREKMPNDLSMPGIIVWSMTLKFMSNYLTYDIN